jgi:AcrR family transcriptional regulator
VARTVGSTAPETRRRILDSAADAFAAHGYSGASMRDIAEGLGITKAALYYHFASKEDLLDGLVQPVMQTMADFADTAQTGGLTAEQVLSGFIDLTIESIPALFPLMVDPGARSAIKERYDLQDLTHRIEAALAGNGGTDAQLRAQFVLGGIRSLVVTRLLGGMRGREKCAAAGGQAGAGHGHGHGHGQWLGQGTGLGAGSAGGTGADPDQDAVPAPALSKSECALLLEAALAGLVTSVKKTR